MNALPAGWRWSSVAEVGSSDLGRQRHPDWHTGAEMRPYLRVANVFEDRIDTSDVKEMDFTGCFDRFRLAPGDVLLNEGQSPEFLGRPAIYRGVPEDVAFTNTLIRFRPGPDITSEWALLVFRHYMHSGRFARESRITTNIAHLSMSRFKTVEFPVPCLQEQRRIVDLLEEHLSSLDAAEGNLRRAQLRANSLLAQHLNAMRRWPAVPLPEVAEIQGGIQKQQKRAPRDNSYPFLRVANVTAGGLDLSEVHKVELFDGEIDRLRLQAGDLLVVEGNGSPSQIGRAALWDGSIEDCVHQNHLIRVRADRSKLLPGYLEAVWNSPENRKVLTDVSSSSSGLHTLSVSKLRRILIPLPSLAEQEHASNELAEARETHRRLTHALVQAERRSTRLRQALLAAAFSGRLTGRSSDSELIEELADQEAS